MTRAHYFAYGSNLSSRRLLSRIPGARFVCVAALDGYLLCFHKIGRDGSAKCDIKPGDTTAITVWGAVYSITRGEIEVLDKLEGRGEGYEQQVVTLTAPIQSISTAFTYTATQINTSLRPFHWYKTHVMVGAMERSLPSAYIHQIGLTPSLPDPNHARHQNELAIYL